MIGVFDSGFGGLTILRALARLPQSLDLVYFGDNARAPYGNRSGPEILQFTQEGAERLFQAGCRLVIIACNTASVIALSELQKNWIPNRLGRKVNLLGIVVPTIEQVTGVPWTEKKRSAAHADLHHVGVFATLRTVESGVYPIEISKRRGDIVVHQEACPGLVSAIETGESREQLRLLVEKHVQALVARVGQAPRRVILGCTHYSLLHDLFESALGEKVEIVSQPDAVATSLSSYLQRHPEFEIARGQGKVRLMTSGFAPSSLARIESYWGQAMNFENVPSFI